MATTASTPVHPILYVCGYAMTEGEIEQTTADPFCDFKLGSTMMRAMTDKQTQSGRFVFESTAVRLGVNSVPPMFTKEKFEPEVQYLPSIKHDLLYPTYLDSQNERR